MGFSLISALILLSIFSGIFALPPRPPVRGRAAPPRSARTPSVLAVTPPRVLDTKTPIDIVLLTDPMYSVGIAAIINAARTHTTSPVRFWIGFDGEPSLLLKYLSCVGVDSAGVTIRRPVNFLADKSLKAMEMVKGKERLTSSANFARFVLPQIFPELTTIWYLDVDALPLTDLTGPTREFVASGAALRPVIRDGTIAKQFPDPFAIIEYYRKVTSRSFSMNAPSWNAGVWQADLRQWGVRDIAANAAKWIDIKAAYKGRTPLWKLATQPLMYLLFHEDVKNKAKFMPTAWNCESILLSQDFGARVPPGCNLLHWNGAEKPWDPAARGHALWAKYLPAFGREECQEIQPKFVAPSPSAPPAPLSCVNRVLDGDETDVDCGGAMCKPCASGRTCLQDSDCLGNAEDITSESESMVVCAEGSTKGLLVCVDFRVADEADGDYDDDEERPETVVLNAVVTGLPLPLLSGRVSAAVCSAVAAHIAELGITSLPPSDILIVHAQGSGLGLQERSDTQVTTLSFRLLVPKSEPAENSQHEDCRDTACLAAAVNGDADTLAETLQLTFTVALPELAGVVSVQLSPAVPFVPTLPSPAPSPVPVAIVAPVKKQDGGQFGGRFWLKVVFGCGFIWSIAASIGVTSLTGLLRVLRAPMSMCLSNKPGKN